MASRKRVLSLEERSAAALKRKEQNKSAIAALLETYEVICDNNSLEPVGDVVAKLVAAAEEGNRCEELFLDSLDPRDGHALLTALIETRFCIKTLRLWNGSLRSADSLAALSKYYLASLLDVRNSGITAADASLLCETIKHSQHLRQLVLDYNPLGDDGCSILAPVLAQSTSLRTLSLAFCNIGSVGATHLANGPLAISKTLFALVLKGNAIGSGGMSHIAAVLSAATHAPISRLDISDTAAVLDPSLCVQLSQAVANCPQLTSLYIDGSAVTAPGSAILQIVQSGSAKLVDVRVSERLDGPTFKEILRTLDLRRRKRNRGGDGSGGEAKRLTFHERLRMQMEERRRKQKERQAAAAIQAPSLRTAQSTRRRNETQSARRAV